MPNAEEFTLGKQVSDDNSMKVLRERIESAKESRCVTSKNTAEKVGENKEAGVGLRVATDVIAGVLLGAYIGYQLDRFFATKPWLLIVFTILGFSGGVVNGIRVTQGK